jgi:hypothetical protein
MSIGTAARRRRRKRVRIFERLHELQYETPVERVRQMNQEFGPYWYYLMEFDGVIPEELKESDRYLRWVRNIDPLAKVYK